MCRAHSNQNQNIQNSIQFKWRQISLGDSTSGVDAHEPEPARTRSRTSDRMFDSYVVVTTSLFKQRDAELQLHASRSSSATCTERLIEPAKGLAAYPNDPDRPCRFWCAKPNLKQNQGPKVLDSSLARGPLQCQSEHYNRVDWRKLSPRVSGCYPLLVGAKLE